MTIISNIERSFLTRKPIQERRLHTHSQTDVERLEDRFVSVYEFSIRLTVRQEVSDTSLKLNQEECFGCMHENAKFSLIHNIFGGVTEDLYELLDILREEWREPDDPVLTKLEGMISKSKRGEY